MSTRTEMVERALGVKVPPDYADFLEKYGLFEGDGVEVYGLNDEIVDIGGIPCVIGATKILRKADGLPISLLVVQHTGYEDEIICLDTKSGEVYSICLGNKKKVANSFREWFASLLKEYLLS